MSFIEKTIDLINELQELAEDNNLCIQLSSSGQARVSIIRPNKFISCFKQFDVESTGFDNFPFEAFVEVDGVRFSSLLTQEEYEKYVLKTA